MTGTVAVAGADDGHTSDSDGRREYHVEPFVALMRRYCFDYTNRADLAVCREIIRPDYQLHMGEHDLVGREEAYIPAAVEQFKQFPTLTLTVHEIVTNGERLALRFSEHGASARHGGRQAAWGGVGLYRWDGRQLVENCVEQDYLSRRRQLGSGLARAVEPPGVDPWAAPAAAERPPTRRAAEEWLRAGDLAAAEDVRIDDSRAEGEPLAVTGETVVVSDLFTAGDRAAFRVGVHGAYRGGLEDAADAEAVGAGGERCVLHVAGLLRVEDGEVREVRAISDRLGLRRRLLRRASGPEARA